MPHAVQGVAVLGSQPQMTVASSQISNEMQDSPQCSTWETKNKRKIRQGMVADSAGGEDVDQGTGKRPRTQGTKTRPDNLSILRQARADLDEALALCEERLASMEGEFLRRSPNALTASPRQYFKKRVHPAPHATDFLPPAPSLERAIRRKVDPDQRIFSLASRTSAFWKDKESLEPENNRKQRYRYGIDPPPLGHYASNDPSSSATLGRRTEVIAYDAFRQMWVPVSKRQLERVSAAAAAVAGTRSTAGGMAKRRERARLQQSSKKRKTSMATQ